MNVCAQTRKAGRAVAIASMVIVAILALGVLASQADARRSATVSESRALWKVADPPGRCAHPRGKISTVKTAPTSYGIVTVADSNCGNGSFVLRKLGPNKPWRIVLGGSDFGDPERCNSDKKKIPLKVLRDLLAFPALCAD